MARHEITDEQFPRIAHLLPGKPTDRGVTALTIAGSSMPSCGLTA
jgi:hypothetical protein